MDGPRELNGPVCVIGDVDVLGPANVDVPGLTISVPSSAIVDADTIDVEVVAEDASIVSSSTIPHGYTSSTTSTPHTE